MSSFTFIGPDNPKDKVNPTQKLEPKDQQGEGYEEEEEWLSTPMKGTENPPMNGLVAPHLHPKWKDGDMVAGSQ